MKATIIIILMLFATNGINARKVHIKGSVVDAFTKVELVNAKIEAFSANGDSLLEQTVALSHSMSNGVITKHSKFNMILPYKDGQENKILLQVTYPKFDTIRTVIPLNFGKREIEKELKPIEMHRSPIQLDEVTVKASKIKFYYKNDTLVYNANAFMLAEGSMLDALIEQLPGVELKTNGQIFVNGKVIDSILLNGKDFISSNNRLLLDNLGAYTVKELNIYNKLGRTSEFVGYNIGHDSQYVMDVKLKREYSRGTILNLEAAGGTNSRWLGRAFAMHFGSRDRYTFYANTNNLNDSRKPGQSDSWKRSSLQSGERTTEKGGFDYYVQDDKKRWTIQGNVEGSHERGALTQNTDRQNFLTDGDTYDRTRNTGRSNSWSISTKHDFYTRWKMADLTLKPLFRYGKGNNDDISQNVTTLWNNQTDTINTSLWKMSRENNNLAASLGINSTIKFKSSPDFISVKGNVSYATNWMEQNKIYDINYIKEGNKTSQHQLYRNHPNYDIASNLSVLYNYQIKSNLTTTFEIGSDYSKSKKRSDLFLLERIADATGNHAMTNLYNEIPDLGNSYKSQQIETSQFISPRLYWQTPSIWAQVSIPVKLKQQTLHYRRGGKQYDVKRNSIVIDIQDTFLDWNNAGRTFGVKAEYRVSTLLPSLISLVDIEDATDPLNIYEGNPDLKNAYKNTFFMNFKFGKSHYVYMLGGFTSNSLVNGYMYDAKTGTRRYKTYNVSGDWNTGISYRGSFDFGKLDCMDIRTSTDVNFHNAVDMVGENSYTPVKTNVHNLYVTQSMDYNWKIGKQKIGAKVSGTWRHTTSPENGNFKTIDAGEIDYGITGLFKLPANLEISTDIGSNMRFGYASQYLNTSEIIWNARLSYTFRKGQWMVALDGFDLLNQVKNVTYRVNPQGRTEVWTNTLPRYCMLHVQYRLNLLPRKKK